MPGQAARNASTSSSPMTNGGARRTRPGVGLLMMKPRASAAAATSADRVLDQVEPDQQAAAADLGHPGVGGQPGPEPLADGRDPVEQAVLLDDVEDREGGRAGDRVAAEGGAVVARLEQRGGVTQGDAGADRDAAAEALGDGDDVGPTRRHRRTTRPCGRCRSAPRRARAARRAGG